VGAVLRVASNSCLVPYTEVEERRCEASDRYVRDDVHVCGPGKPVTDFETGQQKAAGSREPVQRAAPVTRREDAMGVLACA